MNHIERRELRNILLIAQGVMIVGIQPFGWFLGWYWDRMSTPIAVIAVVLCLLIAGWPTILRLCIWATLPTTDGETK